MLDGLLEGLSSNSFYDELIAIAKERAEFDNLVHLHAHNYYSFLDGFGSPEEHATRAKELGMTALATTNHNHLGGAVEFQKACNDIGITPLLGVELYWTENTNILAMSADERTNWAINRAREAGVDVPEIKGKVKKKDVAELIAPFEYDTKQYHILFIATSQKGWSNLVKLQSEAADKCTYNGRYLCDNEMLRKYNEDIILTTACVGSPVNSLFAKGKDEEAYALLEEWKSIFGERLMVEIQPGTFTNQYVANMKIIDWAKKNGALILATNDVHYPLKEDHDDHDTLLAIGTGSVKSATDRMRYDHDYWLKSYNEMLESFALQIEQMEATNFRGKELYDREEYMRTIIEALDNTNRIEGMCSPIELGSKKPVYPRFDAPHGISSEAYLTQQVYKALYEYKKNNPEINLKVYERRLQEELDIINPKGFAPYMLIVQDYIKWANENGVPTGPGRGSAAGSLVLFFLGVTKMIDPIKYNLLFFRFLTADRSAPPDVDTDFDYDGRHRVIEYLEHKYGKANVSHIGTYSYMGVKSGLKDVGRVLEIDFPTMNGITRQIDEILDKPGAAFKHFDKLKEGDAQEQAKWRQFNQLEEQHPELFRLARRFEGTPRQMGVHASGILITPMPINDLIPTRTKDGIKVTLYTGVQLEALNFIKFDILGLKTITVIKNTLKHISEELSFQDLYDEVKFDDEGIYKIVREKRTEGLFQIESNLFKGMIEEILPDQFNDIVVMNALGRPGPLSAGMPAAYARRKHGEEEAREPLPNTWDITENTLGTIAYQEQLMLISQRVAGFSDNQADSYLRKATAKKDKKKMAICRQWFIYGKRNEPAPEGYDPENLEQPMYDPEGKHGDPVIGGINNGYEKAQLERFWKEIEGYCDYLFNLSHSACYSYITILTSYLKRYYPEQFMAALLSMEENEEKVANYIAATEAMKIRITVPDVNLSGKDFTPFKGRILFGLNSIKGIGEAKVDSIIESRPYESPEQLVEKLPKSILNKTAAVALAKSGALDRFSNNRHELLNRLHDARGDRDDRYDIEAYNDEVCMEFERKTLGAPVSIKPYWDTVKANSKVNERFELRNIDERTDKNGRLMGFLKLYREGSEIKGLVFASNYAKCALEIAKADYVSVQGKKDDKGTLIINDIKKVSSLEEEPKRKPLPDLSPAQEVMQRILA